MAVSPLLITLKSFAAAARPGDAEPWNLFSVEQERKLSRQITDWLDGRLVLVVDGPPVELFESFECFHSHRVLVGKENEYG